MIVNRPPVAPFFTALAFLTRVPVRNAVSTPEAIGRAAAVFPVIGALAGLLSVALLALLPRGLPPEVTAILIVLGGILLTGALHLDGLADTADGFGGGWTREDVLRIMRDHQIGTFGAVALIVALFLEVAAIASLIERNASGRALTGALTAALTGAPVAGRWSLVLLARWLPYARSGDGLGRTVTDYVGNREVTVATLLAVAITLMAAGPRGFVWLAASLVATGLFGWMCRRRIGGITGDTLGASAVLCETLTLVLATVRL